MRLRSGDPGWLVLGVALETLSVAAYAAVLHDVFGSQDGRIGWRASVQITLAGDTATKLLATAGAGGVALSTWAFDLRSTGVFVSRCISSLRG